MFSQPSTIQFSIPSWLAGYASNIDFIERPDERMRLVIAASRKNVEHKTGGPFAAAVFEKHSGKLVSLGVNLVTSQQLSILHAEIVAITLAQKKLGCFDLGSGGMPPHELITTTEPCAMCLGAIPWSGVRRVVAAAAESDVCEIGFDEGPKMAGWKEALEQRGIEVITGLLRSDARQVLQEYQRQGGVIYNSRASGLCCQG